MRARSLGRGFGWLWMAYAVSTCGSTLGFGAFPFIAVNVLHAGPTEVSALPAAALAAGAAVAVPLGGWVESRRTRPVLMAMDLTRFAALLSVPVAFALGWLSLVQLLVVWMIVAAAKIAFSSASGAYLKVLVRREDLLAASGRFEATTWAATMLGPPLGGAAIGLFGPTTTVLADAVSYLLSAAGIGAIGAREPGAHTEAPRRRAGELLDGWRGILAHPALRPLFGNTILVNGLILATEPLLAVLLLGQLGFAPWQFGLAFGAPCIGGLVGSRLARPLVARYGQHSVMLTCATVRVCWPLGLAFVGHGTAGLLLVIAVEFGLITCVGVFNPVFAAYRLGQTPAGRAARTLTAWSVTSNLAIAALTALWGLLASRAGPRAAIALAGVLLLGTPLLLPRPRLSSTLCRDTSSW